MRNVRKTKIICTLGPAVDNEETLRGLMLGGMNAARFNFSHGSHETHLALLNKFKKVREELGLPVATILDTKGPEIRVGLFKEGKVELEQDQTFTLTSRPVEGDSTIVSQSYKGLPADLKVGDHVLIDDGLIDMVVTELTDTDVICRVENGGPLSNNKSVNVPGARINLPSLTDKDRADLKFAVENDMDFIAASFVRKASDVNEIRAELLRHGGKGIRIISKIENQEGLENIDEIIEASDSIMVARGDLGVEIPLWEVPEVQKKMISKTIMAGKPVVTATQMLDSMTRNPRPTRAEVSDVANAVFDGTSCVMLSGETANGKHPVETVETMAKICAAAEDYMHHWKRFRNRPVAAGLSVNDAITHTACQTAMDLDASAILTATKSGHSAKMVSRFRPGCPIVALCPDERVRRQLAISWGVEPYLCDDVEDTDTLFAMCVYTALKEKAVKVGDTVVITAGVPIGKSGSTNLIKAQVVD